ncbi:MAG TPA: hypothetical protein VFC46_16060 [Humisphaera sp.]|nr:hypothetical protein [Humisphaera sp.]
MQSRLLSTTLPVLAALLLAAGCTQNLSTDGLADKVGKPADVHFFGDRAVYMGDQDGYRYVHVRDLFDEWTWLGECTYKIPESDWPMEHPMKLTCNAAKWKDVEWLNGDAPPRIRQNVDLYVTPSFPVGAPKTQPTTMSVMTPATQN